MTTLLQDFGYLAPSKSFLLFTFEFAFPSKQMLFTFYFLILPFLPSKRFLLFTFEF